MVCGGEIDEYLIDSRSVQDVLMCRLIREEVRRAMVADGEADSKETIARRSQGAAVLGLSRFEQRTPRLMKLRGMLIAQTTEGRARDQASLDERLRAPRLKRNHCGGQVAKLEQTPRITQIQAAHRLGGGQHAASARLVAL
jgi:hypothetical protein